jgi:hypothetical protein
LALIILMPAYSQASSLAVSPARIELGNVTRGMEYTVHLTLSTRAKSQNIRFEAYGGVKDWLMPGQAGLTLTKSHVIPLKFKIPETARNGVYDGILGVIAEPPPSDDDRALLAVGTAAYVKLKAHISGDETLWLRVLRAQASSARQGDDIQAEILLKNNAKSPLNPRITLNVLGLDRETVLITQSLTESMQSQELKPISPSLPSDKLAPGMYFLRFLIESDGQTSYDRMEPFYILGDDIPSDGIITVGATLDDARLSAANLTLGEGVTVTASYHNSGDVPVEAQLRVELIQKGREIRDYTGDAAIIEVNQEKTETITVWPEEPGEYVMRIWVEHAGGRTAIRQANVRVWPYTVPLIPFDANIHYLIPPILLLVAGWMILFYRKYYVFR